MPPGIRFLPAPLSEDAPGYDVNAEVDFWVPQALERVSARRADLERGGAAPRPASRLEQARAEVAAIAARQAADDAGAPADDGDGRARSRRCSIAGRRGCSCRSWARRSACSSSPAPMPARCSSRAALRRDAELAVHAALGASRARLVRRALAEHARRRRHRRGARQRARLRHAVGARRRATRPRFRGSTPSRSTAACWRGASASASLTGLLAGLPSALRMHRGGGAARPRSRRTVGAGSRRRLAHAPGADRRADRPDPGPARRRPACSLRSLHNAAAVAARLSDRARPDHDGHRRRLPTGRPSIGAPSIASSRCPASPAPPSAWGLPLTNTGASTRVRASGARRSDAAGLTRPRAGRDAHRSSICWTCASSPAAPFVTPTARTRVRWRSSCNAWPSRLFPRRRIRSGASDRRAGLGRAAAGDRRRPRRRRARSR